MKNSADKSLLYSLWPTAWGPMGAVAGKDGISCIVLPHYQSNDLAELLVWEHPGAQRDDSSFEQLIELSRAYFNGRSVNFDEIECSLPKETTLTGMVLRACRKIAYGLTISYGKLATQIDRPDSARAVAAALGKNPIPLVIPCHRVTYSDGRLGGFSTPGGIELKRRMLDLEKKLL